MKGIKMHLKGFKKAVLRFLCLIVMLSISIQIFPLSVFATVEINGDVSGDGILKLEDARMVLNSLASIEALPEDKLSVADFDDNGEITFEDARLILNMAIDLPPEYLELPAFEQITPKKQTTSSKKAKFCVVETYNAETLHDTPVDNYSNPLYTPLLEGTYDYIADGPIKHEASDNVFYVLKSGRRVYAENVKVFTGYQMPDNAVEIYDKVETTVTDTKIYLKLNWRVPFNVTVKPQAYEKGYNGRVYNIKDGDFTGTYMDIVFYHTPLSYGSVTFPESDVIKSMKWINDTKNKTTTLRIYFKNEGEFFGYNAYYDDNNYLVFSIKEASKKLNEKVIILDPGHGGDDPGAGSSGVYEHTVTHKIALELKALLEKQGATIILTRDTYKEGPDLVDRRKLTYDMNPDLFISIHCDASNSSSANGSSVYYYKNYSGELAYAISKKLPSTVKSLTSYAMVNKGAHFYPFHVTRVENCPSVLVECGFITNANDFKIINSDKGRKALARGIYNGIVEFYS